MLRKNKLNWALLLMIPVLCLILSNPAQAAGIVIDDIVVDGRDSDSKYDIYCREDSVIKIKFHDVGDYERWDLRLENVVGMEIRSGEFDGSSETLNFTTEEVRQLQANNGQSFFEGKVVYSYDVILRVVSSSKKIDIDSPFNGIALPGDAAFDADGDYYYEDGDYDDDYYYDSDTDSDADKETEGTLTHTITVHVDMDPPAAPELNEDVTAGEEALTVSWTPVTHSESGRRESGTMRYSFCVRPVDDGDLGLLTGFLMNASVLLDDISAVDGDYYEYAEVSDDGALPDGEDAVPLAEDGDVESDTELVDDEVTDENDDWTEDEDGDDYEGEEIYGCIDPDSDPVTGSSHKIGGLSNDVTYEIRARSIDAAGNYSLTWSNPVYGSPQQVDDFWESYKRSGGKEKGGFCFIATAAYGTYDHQDVVRLRAFRDIYLSESALGRKFIELYYRYSPPAAKIIEGNSFLRWLARAFLLPVVLWLKLLFEVGLAAKFGILGGLLAVTFCGACLPGRRNAR